MCELCDILEARVADPSLHNWKIVGAPDVPGVVAVDEVRPGYYLLLATDGAAIAARDGLKAQAFIREPRDDSPADRAAIEEALLLVKIGARAKVRHEPPTPPLPKLAGAQIQARVFSGSSAEAVPSAPRKGPRVWRMLVQGSNRVPVTVEADGWFWRYAPTLSDDTGPTLVVQAFKFREGADYSLDEPDEVEALAISMLESILVDFDKLATLGRLAQVACEEVPNPARN